MKYLIILSTLCCVIGIGCKPAEERERDRQASQNAAQDSDQSAQESRVAGVGVGRQGQSFGELNPANPANFIAAPAKAYFQIKERIVFDQIHKLMDLYRATNGYLPKTHESFMKELADNRIKLPELPVGQIYRYRPDEGELYVEPANANETP
ncbi:hypothetical protein SH449x_000023 [Pirellulaceae bacterium SH449]